MTELELDALERLDGAGTPRPWSPDFSQILGANGERVFGAMNAFVCEPYVGDPDTELLCAAVNALPILIQRLRDAEAVIDGWKAQDALQIAALRDKNDRVAQLLTRNAQLERVREAAEIAVEDISSPGADRSLRAALAAASEGP